MQDTMSDAQCEILHNLNDIDKICSNQELSNNDIDLLYDKYLETIQWIDDNLNSIENGVAVQLIEFLKHFFDVG